MRDFEPRALLMKNPGGSASISNLSRLISLISTGCPFIRWWRLPLVPAQSRGRLPESPHRVRAIGSRQLGNTYRQSVKRSKSRDALQVLFARPLACLAPSRAPSVDRKLGIGGCVERELPLIHGSKTPSAHFGFQASPLRPFV